MGQWYMFRVAPQNQSSPAIPGLRPYILGIGVLAAGQPARWFAGRSLHPADELAKGFGPDKIFATASGYSLVTNAGEKWGSLRCLPITSAVIGKRYAYTDRTGRPLFAIFYEKLPAYETTDGNLSSPVV